MPSSSGLVFFLAPPLRCILSVFFSSSQLLSPVKQWSKSEREYRVPGGGYSQPVAWQKPAANYRSIDQIVEKLRATLARWHSALQHHQSYLYTTYYILPFFLNTLVCLSRRMTSFLVLYFYVTCWEFNR